MLDSDKTDLKGAFKNNVNRFDSTALAEINLGFIVDHELRYMWQKSTFH